LTESIVKEVFLKNEPNAILDVPPDWGYAALMQEKRFTLAHDTLCSLDYDLRDLNVEGLKWFKANPNGEINVHVRKKASLNTEEGPFQGWSEFPISSTTALFEQTEKQLDLATHQPLLVGPYARFRLTGENNYHYDRVRDILGRISPEWKQNTLFFSLLRLVETLELSQDAISTIDAGIDIDADLNPLPKRPVSRQGWAAVEAPRGTLIHHYRVTAGGYIVDADIFVPTDINFAAIRALIGAIVERIAGSAWAQQPKKLLAILNIALRTFDPCISCLAR
jgi:coenzyme F420-reducing hydrogenase alpha subunit